MPVAIADADSKVPGGREKGKGWEGAYWEVIDNDQSDRTFPGQKYLTEYGASRVSHHME